MAETWISTHADEFNRGKGVVFAIIQNGTGALSGAVGLTINQRFMHAELGYWIAHDFWKKGIATEAAAEVLQYAFGKRHLQRVYATHMVHNPASGRVMQKLGMLHEGTLRQHVLKDGKFVDLETYAILQDEWSKRQG